MSKIFPKYRKNFCSEIGNPGVMSVLFAVCVQNFTEACHMKNYMRVSFMHKANTSLDTKQIRTAR